MSLAALLGSVVEVLQECGIPYMLTGSLAGAYYALPRATQDADLVVDPDASQIECVVERLRERGLYVSETAAREALRDRGQFNAIDPAMGWKVDLIIRRDRPFSRLEFSRRRSAKVQGIAVSLTSLEDLVLIKLEWSRMGDSELQRRDVQQLVGAGWEDLDREYVSRWAAELGVQAEWQQVVVAITANQEGEP